MLHPFLANYTAFLDDHEAFPITPSSSITFLDIPSSQIDRKSLLTTTLSYNIASLNNHTIFLGHNATILYANNAS